MAWVDVLLGKDSQAKDGGLEPVIVPQDPSRRRRETF